MTPLGYLLDEHTPLYWVAAVRRADPRIRITRVGRSDAPPRGTTDPDLLLRCEADTMVLVTCDRRSMYDHIAVHTDAGRVFRGMLLVNGPITTPELIGDLQLIFESYGADDFIDTVMTLPL